MNILALRRIGWIRPKISYILTISYKTFLLEYVCMFGTDIIVKTKLSACGYQSIPKFFMIFCYECSSNVYSEIAIPCNNSGWFEPHLWNSVPSLCEIWINWNYKSWTFCRKHAPDKQSTTYISDLCMQLLVL